MRCDSAASSASASSCCEIAAPSAAFSALSAAAAASRAWACCAASSSSCAFSSAAAARAASASCFCLRHRVALRVELVLELRDAAGVGLALVVDPLQVVLALDQLARAVGGAEQPDHRGAVAVSVEEDRAAAHVVARRRELLLGGVEPSPAARAASRPRRSTVACAAASRSLAAATRVLTSARLPSSRCVLGLGLDHLGAGRVLGRAGLAGLLLELLLLVALLGHRRCAGARRDRERCGGREEQRGQGTKPAHRPMTVNNISHNSNSTTTS